MISSGKAWMVTLVALALGLATGWLLTVKSAPTVQVRTIGGGVGAASSAAQKSTASIMIDFGDGTLKTYHNLSLQQNESLRMLLEQTMKANNITFESKTYDNLGTLITQIGDKKNGTGSKYWQYWVNNEKVQVGADMYIVKGGDVIEWKFLGDIGS